MKQSLVKKLLLTKIWLAGDDKKEVARLQKLNAKVKY